MTIPIRPLTVTIGLEGILTPGSVLFWVALIILPLQAQEMSLRFADLETRDTLAHTTVNAIAQDSFGFMWFATRSGLTRFDGIAFKDFPLPQNGSDGLSGNDLNAMLCDQKGMIWIGSWGRGLIRFNPGTESFTPFPLLLSGLQEPSGAEPNSSHPREDEATSGLYIQSLFEDGSGRLWVGTLRRGFFLFERDSGRFLKVNLNAPDPSQSADLVIRQTVEDEAGILWLGSNQGLFRYDPSTGSTLSVFGETTDAEPPNNDSIFSLGRSEDGLIWAGTADGLLKIDPQARHIRRIKFKEEAPAGSLEDQYWELVVDESGFLWLVSYGSGLKRFDPRTETFISAKHDPANGNSVGSNYLSCLFLDRSGGLWIGSQESGISFLNLKAPAFVHYRRDPQKDTGLSGNNISAIFEDDDAVLWVGTAGSGLNRYDRNAGANQVFRHVASDKTSLADNGIQAIYRHQGGHLWVATQTGVLHRMDPQSQGFKRFPLLPFKQHPGKGYVVRIWQLSGHGNGDILVGSDYGLLKFNPSSESAQAVSLPTDSVLQPRVFSLFREADGSTLIGTSQGLFHWPGAGAGPTPLTASPAGTGKNLEVRAIHRDGQDKLWIGTSDGLAVYQPDNPNLLFLKHQKFLYKTVINAVYEDTLGCLWMATNRSLLRYDTQLDVLRRYDAGDGLQSHMFNSKSDFQSKSGELFFGGVNGFNSFFPDQIMPNQYIPPVAITSLRLGNEEMDLERPIHQTQKIVLDHKHHALSFRFASLNFVSPEENNFLYKLEGFDTQWIKGSPSDSVTYTNLGPGNYTFKVQGSNNDGYWNREGAKLDIAIIPPFYRQAWFYGLVFILLLVMFFVANRRRRRNELKLERLVAERTQSLRDTNLCLQATADSLREAQAKFIDSAHRAGMAEIASDVLHNIGNALNSVHVSASMIESRIQSQRIDFLKNLGALLERNSDSLAQFLSQDQRGRLLPQAVAKLGLKMEEEQDLALTEIKSLHEQLFHINEIIAFQRQYTLAESFNEKLDVQNLIEDVLLVQEPILLEFGIQVVKEYREVPSILGSKPLFLHIINHLIRNACEALASCGSRENRKLTLRLKRNRRGNVRLEVKDNGKGIERENLTSIFSHNASSKKVSKSGGLHYCANTISEMGGSIGVKSKGLGAGATFMLEIPLLPKSQRQEESGEGGLGWDSGEFERPSLKQLTGEERQLQEELKGVTV